MLSRLRHARHLARFVLAWFVLSLGVAVASPVVAPKSMQLVCSGPAMKMVVADDQGNWVEIGHNGMDCPLCAVLSAPPAQPVVEAAAPFSLSHVLHATCCEGAGQQASAPWQARAPPAHS